VGLEYLQRRRLHNLPGSAAVQDRPSFILNLQNNYFECQKEPYSEIISGPVQYKPAEETCNY